MEKIIFKKLYSEILRVFLIILFSLSILIWLLQAVNLLDIISEDGHGVDVYFQYTLLNLPKIISKAYLLSYFLALFYVISKYEETNQLLIFWTFGIKKITFLNKLLKISFLFFIFSFILYFLISPYTQNKSRSLIKSSDLDFFTSLIKQKTFIDTVQGLTFFVNDKNNNQIQNIILKDATNPNKIQIILAEKGSVCGFAGKRVIQDTVRETLPDEFQTAEYVRDHGFIDLVIERKYLNSTVGTLLNVLLKKQEAQAKQDSNVTVDKSLQAAS